MTCKLPDRVIEVIVKALENGDLIQKQARLCDLAALDAIPSEILPYLKLHHQKAIALSYVTSQRILSNLANSKDKKIRQAIPKNYHRKISLDYYDSPEYLEMIALSMNYSVRNKVANHPNAPLEALKLLVHDSIPFVRASLARNPNSTKEIVQKVLFYKQDPKDLINRKITPPISINVEGKEYFVQAPIYSGDGDALRAAASSPKLSLDILEQLIEFLSN